MNPMKSCHLALLLCFICTSETYSLAPLSIDRRHLLGGLLSSSSTLFLPGISLAIEGKGGSVTRVEGIGGGLDITSSTTEKGKDIIYPASMEGPWNVRRVVSSIEGDAGQAELAWSYLGGCGPIKEIESFQTQFLVPRQSLGVANKYEVNGETFKGCVMDRGFEISSRKNVETFWDMLNPDALVYKKDGSEVEIAVIQRKIELPSEKGFGYSELYRVTSSAGGIFSESKVQRAIKVQRRYRRAMEDGNRIVEGLEIQKTYRVLDGIAGVEMPTSTMKSSLKLRRN